MQLTLRWPLTAEYAPSFASVWMVYMLEVEGVITAYTELSVYAVDDYLEELRREKVTPETMGHRLFEIGCYVGELMVRNADASWVPVAETTLRELPKFLIVIKLPDGRIVNPFGVVITRLTNGPESSVAEFYQAVTGRVVKPLKKRSGRRRDKK